MRGDAGVGAPVVVVLRELRRDDIAEHVRRARSEHLREGRDRPRHLRAERREGRHGDQGIFHPQSALLGNPGFVNGAVSGLGRGRGRCAGAWVGSRARFDPRASPDIRRSARRCRRLGSQRGAACSPRPISDLLIQQTLEFILARSERGLRPIHLARRVVPDTTPRTSIADVVPDRARALGVDQGAGIHRPPGRRPRAWWTRRHRVSARRA